MLSIISGGSSTAGFSYGGDLHYPSTGSGEFVMQPISTEVEGGRG